jgi:hypothetical protein
MFLLFTAYLWNQEMKNALTLSLLDYISLLRLLKLMNHAIIKKKRKIV